MDNKVGNDIFDKYLEIKQDIIGNLKHVFNRQTTYTKKYRGNRFTDINVAFDTIEDNKKIIQIYIRHKDKYIRDRIMFNKKGLLGSEIKTNINIHE
jgi:hypothetical protein